MKEKLKAEFLRIYHLPRKEMETEMLPFLQENFKLDNSPGEFLNHFFTNVAKDITTEDYPVVIYGMISGAFDDLIRTEGNIKNA